MVEPGAAGTLHAYYPPDRRKQLPMPVRPALGCTAERKVLGAVGELSAVDTQ